jgi:hypothetical protein
VISSIQIHARPESTRAARRAGWIWRVLVALAVLAAPAAAGAAVVQNNADSLRTGWYPNQPSLSPSTVASNFGLQRTVTLPAVNGVAAGQVYAQPLVANGKLVVVTESNNVYALDAVTGAVDWARNVGTPYTIHGCSDLVPTIGITSTPVIDTNAAGGGGVVYFVANTTDGHPATSNSIWQIHAVSLADGSEQPGFPVTLDSTITADPRPGVAGYRPPVFAPDTQLQRPGLLLQNGVVYAAFGSHCDLPPYSGWVFGVDATSGSLDARFATVSAADPATDPNWAADQSGGGIWQAGGGLVGDGAGHIWATTGNGGAIPDSQAVPGTAPPANLGESVIRLDQASGGSLTARDFFSPSDASTLDAWDADFASGAPVGLPDSFGSVAHPHLLFEVGKAGYVYLLDRDNLGGKVANGGGAQDHAVARLGPDGGVWSHAAAWPGDGGYIWVPTATPSGGQASGSAGALHVYQRTVNGAGVPDLSLVGRSGDAFPFRSGSPIITSDATTSGSGVVWIIWSSTDGTGAQLRAYNATPDASCQSASGCEPIFESTSFAFTKFAPPGVGDGLLYVPTTDGHVLFFGIPANEPISGPAANFGSVTLQTTASRSVTLTANAAGVVITDPSQIQSSNAQFAVNTAAISCAATVTQCSFPLTLNTGDTVTLPVTFTPTKKGVQAGTLFVHTSAGSSGVNVTGTGRLATGDLVFAPTVLSFGGVVNGAYATQSLTITNQGGQDVTITGVQAPSAPWSVDTSLAPGLVIHPDEVVGINVTFSPQTSGAYPSVLAFTSDVTGAGAGARVAVQLTGAGVAPPRMTVPAAVALGAIPVGGSVLRSFVITNHGEATLTIMKSKPPGGAFGVVEGLPEGTTIAGGGSTTVTLRVSPTSPGPVAAQWMITGNDGLGEHALQLTGVALDRPRVARLARINQHAVVGAALRCANARFAGTSVNVTIRWLTRTGRIVATGTSLRVPARLLGQVVTCRVTAANSVGTAATTASPVRVSAATLRFSSPRRAGRLVSGRLTSLQPDVLVTGGVITATRHGVVVGAAGTRRDGSFTIVIAGSGPVVLRYRPGVIGAAHAAPVATR